LSEQLSETQKRFSWQYPGGLCEKGCLPERQAGAWHRGSCFGADVSAAASAALRMADPESVLQTAEDKDKSQSTSAWKFQPV